MKRINKLLLPLLVVISLLVGSLTTFATQTTKEEIKPIDIHFIDTGNSDSILILDNGKSMLIDGAENDDEKLLVDYLTKLGIKELDYMVLTHPDADHSGGLDNVLKNIKVKNVLIGNGSADTKTYKDFVQAATDKNLKPSVPLDSEFTLGKGKFKFYNQKSQAKDVNDRSLVMLYTFDENKFLFTGDAGIEVEKVLPLKEIGKVDVLKVGHHGSKTSSSDAFIKSLSPKHSVICVGKDNKYNHPTTSVLDTLKKYNSQVFRTDLNGNIVITSDGKTITVKPTKETTVTPTGAATSKPNEIVSPKPTTPTSNSGTVVYITKTGKKYHLGTCKTLKSKIESTIEKAKASGLTACEVCKP